MNVRELEDGRVLIHCFAGCAAAEIMDAVGLSLADLFPGDRPHHTAPARRAWNFLDVLRCVAFEVLIVVACANTLAQGKPLSEVDRARLASAANRLQRALEVAGDA